MLRNHTEPRQQRREIYGILCYPAVIRGCEGEGEAGAAWPPPLQSLKPLAVHSHHPQPAHTPAILLPPAEAGQRPAEETILVRMAAPAAQKDKQHGVGLSPGSTQRGERAQQG